MRTRVGQGIDFHRLAESRKLLLGGVCIPSEKGCEAHSDGDVLIHAICDALLGAAGLKDIGHHFPDTDPDLKDIDSRILLKKTSEFIRKEGFQIVNIDSTVCLEKPKISSYIDEMKKSISAILGIGVEFVSIKATTTEKMGFTGREEGIFAIAVALIEK
ncbi:MAG: 2-C-methyl-D-erythritol 2,4-cyclodiphosphate synthase [Bacteroidales bacterium]|jgi:2-C-methyl-D-erythritol 2,4-cyclodiphosphate synthase